ncbi:MAG: A/G-specific adenine glycosylase [Terriglobales bacterium]
MPNPALSLFQGPSLGAFRTCLLRWFHHHRRPLPWRRDTDPYRVWVSEIMLQQTRVAAVLEHYRRFLQRFPTVEDLAHATPSSVLAAWSGLGYYRRARLLHQAARQIVRAGHFPETAEQWRQLPGIGRYTAAAIASIAFHQPCAVVDGNVRRVLERILATPTASRKAYLPPALQQCWEIAEKLLSRAHPGDFNQAMMELGATICLPTAPKCEQCPVARWCASHSRPNGLRTKAPKRHQQKVAYLLLTNSRKVYLVQRPPDAALMPAMWELPTAKCNYAHSPALLQLRHAITNTDYRVTVRRGEIHDAGGGKWVSPIQASRLPLTGLTRKVLRRFGII